MKRGSIFRPWGPALAGCFGMLALGALLWPVFPLPSPEEAWFEEAPLPDPETFGLTPGAAYRLPPRGKARMLVLFTQFQGQTNALPSFADALFQPDRQGSFTHFFHTMSWGQLQVQGTVLPAVYTSDAAAAAYVADLATQYGRYGAFVREILDQVDADCDLGEFDNDGPDGMPDSGDDDGVVDYICVILCQKPAGTSLPSAFSAGPNYPNPFAQKTYLPYDLPADASVRLDLYNSLGQRVRRLVDEDQRAGAHEAVWTGRDEKDRQVSSGVYLYALEADGPERWSDRGKMLFLSSGYAQLPVLDRWLEGLDEEERGGCGILSEEEGTLGLIPDRSAAAAAFLAARLWISLQVAGSYPSDPTAFPRRVRQLSEVLAAFEPAARQPIERRLAKWHPGNRIGVAEGGRALARLMHQHSELADLSFALGTWLEPLKLATRMARDRGAPLEEILDLSADAAAARHFAAALEAIGGSSTGTQGLEALAAQLENAPRTLRALGAVLEGIARVETEWGSR